MEKPRVAGCYGTKSKNGDSYGTGGGRPPGANVGGGEGPHIDVARVSEGWPEVRGRDGEAEAESRLIH